MTNRQMLELLTRELLKKNIEFIIIQTGNIFEIHTKKGKTKLEMRNKYERITFKYLYCKKYVDLIAKGDVSKAKKIVEKNKQSAKLQIFKQFHWKPYKPIRRKPIDILREQTGKLSKIQK